jgi:antirestriction protein ArdC
MASTEIYDNVTDRLVQMFEAGAADPKAWQAPWRTLALRHRSAVGRAYRGLNTLLLSDAAHHAGYELPVWATFQQWKTLGTSVRSGEHGTRVLLWKQYSRQVADEFGDETTANGLYATTFTVFNAAQVENADASPAVASVELPRNPDGRDDVAETWVTTTGAEIDHGGNAAYYTPAADRIAVPTFDAFTSAGGYYSTVAHELTHWTGHPSRLDRDLSGRFGTESYAAEELVAELGSAFAMARLGLEAEPRADHAHYLASWATLLRHDNRAIFTAASRAQTASDYLFGGPAE